MILRILTDVEYTETINPQEMYLTNLEFSQFIKEKLAVTKHYTRFGVNKQEG